MPCKKKLKILSSCTENAFVYISDACSWDRLFSQNAMTQRTEVLKIIADTNIPNIHFELGIKINPSLDKCDWMAGY